MARYPNVLVIVVAVGVSATVLAEHDPTSPSAEMKNAYNRLLSADDWREARESGKQLAQLGEKAIPLVIEGTRHKKKLVREYCYEILREHFPSDPRSIEAIIAGLSDKEGKISYVCAFHLGEHRINQAAQPLKACIKDATRERRTRYAAVKSLAELGDDSVMDMLYRGLGSDNYNARYLSNRGILALCGRDLSAFGYEGPSEGARVSGGQALLVEGMPIEKARRRLERWKAIVAFLEWLKSDRPQLFAKLDKLW